MTDSVTVGVSNTTGTGGTISPAATNSVVHSPEQIPPIIQQHVDDANSRVQINESDVVGLSNADWAARWRQQDTYINTLEHRLHRQEGEVSESQQREQRQRYQLTESQQREKVLVRRLAAKEQETHDLVLQLAELKTSTVVPTPTSLRSTYLDPAVNTLYTLLRGELHAAKSRLDDTQHELAAWKFTPDSNTGKRLMAKCRLLHQENEELGRMTSSGRIAMLEGELALQKGFSEEVRQSQTELESFLADLEEDVEGMQSTIMLLQQELRRCKDQLQAAEKANSDLQTQLLQQTTATTTTMALNQQQNGLTSTIRANGENNNVNVNNNSDLMNGELIISDDGVATEVKVERASEGGDADADNDDDDDDDLLGQSRTKRVRRSSVLSIDYECEEDAMDDMLVITSNGDVAMSDAE